MITTLPGVAVPDTVGEVVVDTPTGSVTVRLGAPAAVKLVTAATLDPPALVATAVTEFTPTPALITHEYDPEAVAVVEQSIVLLAPVKVTTLAGVAVPDTVGVRVVTTPRGLLMATVGWATVVKLTPWLADPPGPEAVTVTLTGPTGRPLRPHEKLPLLEAVVEQSVAPLGPLMITTLPGVAVPDTVGEVVVDTPTGSVTVRLGAPAAVKLVTSATLLPPALLATAVTEFTPTPALITQL
jgi:hypothetical protein